MENWRERAKFFLDAAANDPANAREYEWYANVAEQYAQQEEARQGAANADVNALIGLGKTAASSAAHWAPLLAMGTGPVGMGVGAVDLLAGHPIGRTVDELMGLPVGEKPTWGDTAQEALTMALLGGQGWIPKAAGGLFGAYNIAEKAGRSQEELKNLGVDANMLESVAQAVAGPAIPGQLTGGDPVGSVMDAMMVGHGITRNPIATKMAREAFTPQELARARSNFPWLMSERGFTEDVGTGGATYQYGPTEGGVRIDPRLTKQGEYQEAFRQTSPGSFVEPEAPSVLGKLVRMARKVYNPEALTMEDMAKFMGDEKGREIKPGAVNTAKSNKIAVWTDYLREKWLRNEPYESVDEKGRTTQRIDPNEHATAESYIEEVLKHEFGHVLRPDVSEYRATRTGQRAADRGAMYGDLYENAQGMDRPERARRLGGMPEPLEEAQSGAQEPPAPIRQKAVVEQPYQYTPKAGTDYHEALKFMRKSGAISGRNPKATELARMMREQGYDPTFALEAEQRMAEAESVAAKGSAERTQAQLGVIGWMMNTLGIEGRRNFINGALGREIKGWRDIRESEISTLMDAVTSFGKTMEEQGRPALEIKGGKSFGREIDYRKRQAESASAERAQGGLAGVAQRMNLLGIEGRRNFINGTLGREIKGWRDIRESEIPALHDAMDRYERVMEPEAPAFVTRGGGKIKREINLPERQARQRKYEEDFRNLEMAEEAQYENAFRRLVRMDERRRVQQKRKGSLDKIVKPKFSTEKDKEEDKGLLSPAQITARVKYNLGWIDRVKDLTNQAKAVLFKRLYPDESYRLGEAGEDVTEKLSSRMAEEAPEVLRDKLTPTDVILNSRDLMGKDVRYDESLLARRQKLSSERKFAEAEKLTRKIESKKNYDTLLLRQAAERLKTGDNVHVEMVAKDTYSAIKHWLLPALRESVLDLGQKIYVHFPGARDKAIDAIQSEINQKDFMDTGINEVEVTNKPMPQGAVLASRPVKATEGAARRRTTAEAALASTGLAEERLEAQRGVEAARGKYREATKELRAQKTPAAKRELMRALSEGRQAVAKRSALDNMFRKSRDYKPIRGELGQALVGEVESADQMRMIKAGRALYPEAKKEGRRLKILAEAAKHAEVPLEEFGIYKDETGTIIKSKPGKLGLKDAREILHIRGKAEARNFTNQLLGKRTVTTGESNPVVDAVVRAFGGKELLDNIAKKFSITPETVRTVKAAKTPQERTKAIRSVIDDLEAAHPFLKFSTEKPKDKGWMDKMSDFIRERMAGIQRLTDEWLTSSLQGTEEAFETAMASMNPFDKYVASAKKELSEMNRGVAIGQDIRRRVTNLIDHLDLRKKWDALRPESPLLGDHGVDIAEKLPGYEQHTGGMTEADNSFLRAIRQLNRYIDKINKTVYGEGYKSRKNYITHIMKNIVEKDQVQRLTTGQRKLIGSWYESFITDKKMPDMEGAPEAVKAVAQKYFDAHKYLVDLNAPLMDGIDKAFAGVKEIVGSQMEKDLDIRLEELGSTLKPSKAGFIQRRVLASHGKYGMQNLKEVVTRQLLAFARTVPDHVTIRSLQRLLDTTTDSKGVTHRPLGEMILDPQTYNRLKTDYDLAVAERFYPSKYTEVGKTSWASRMMDSAFGIDTGLTPFPNQAAGYHLAGIMYQNRLVRPDFYAMNALDALFKTSFKYNLLSRKGLGDFLSITGGLTVRMSLNYASAKFLGGKASPIVKLAAKYAPSRKNLATLLVSGHSEGKGLVSKIPGVTSLRKLFNWGSERIEGQEHANSMMIWAIEAELQLRSQISNTAIKSLSQRYGSVIEAYAEGGAGRAEVMKLLDAAGNQPGKTLLNTLFSKAVVEMKRDQGHSDGFFSKSPLGYRLTALGKNHLSVFLQVLGKMYTNYPSTLMTQMVRAMSKSKDLAEFVSPTGGLMLLSAMAYGAPVALANEMEADPKNRRSKLETLWGAAWKDLGVPTRLVPLSLAGGVGNILTGRDVKAGAHELASNFMPGYYLGYKTGVWDKIFKENKK